MTLGIHFSSQMFGDMCNVAGKGENIWDTFCHEKGHVDNDDTGDVACDSYHLYKEDIKLIKNLGVRYNQYCRASFKVIYSEPST